MNGVYFNWASSRGTVPFDSYFPLQISSRNAVAGLSLKTLRDNCAIENTLIISRKAWKRMPKGNQYAHVRTKLHAVLFRCC